MIKYICSGCNCECHEEKKNKFVRDELCRPCYQQWDELDAKGQAYLKDLRAHGEFL